MSEFWLSEKQFGRLRPLLLNKVRGVARVDDRRVISGIIHVLKSGGRWADAPACTRNTRLAGARRGVDDEVAIAVARLIVAEGLGACGLLPVAKFHCLIGLFEDCMRGRLPAR